MRLPVILRLIALAALVLNGPGAVSAYALGMSSVDATPVVVHDGCGMPGTSGEAPSGTLPASHCGGSTCHCGCAGPAAAPIAVTIVPETYEPAPAERVARCDLPAGRTAPPFRPPAR